MWYKINFKEINSKFFIVEEKDDSSVLMSCKHWLRSMKRFLVCLLSTRALMIQLKLKVIWKLCLSRAQSWSSFDSSQDKEPRTSGTHQLQQIRNQKVFYNCQRLAIELIHGAE